MTGSLALLAIIGFVPLMLLAIYGLLRWRYARWLGTTTLAAPTAEAVDARDAHGSAPIRVGPPVTFSDAKPEDSSRVAAIVDRAARAKLRTQAAFAVPIAFYALLFTIIEWFSFAPRVLTDGRVATLAAMLVPYLVVCSRVLALSWQRTIGLLAGAVLCGAVVLLTVATPGRAALLAVSVAELSALVPSVGVMLISRRQLRPLLSALTGVVLYIAVQIVAAAVVLFPRMDEVARMSAIIWVMAIGSQAAGLLLFAWLLRRRSRRMPIMIVGAMTAISLVIRAIWHPDPPVATFVPSIALNAAQAWFVYLVFGANIWLQERGLLAPQSLQSHLALGLLTAWNIFLVLVGRGSFVRPVWFFSAVIAAYCGYVALHHLLLYVARRHASSGGPRLLLLRVFGSRRRSTRLLAAMDDTWRWIGSIDLIAGTDLALSSDDSRPLHAFLARRPGEYVLSTHEEVARRIGRTSNTSQADGRYPVNDFVCTGDIWQTAFRALSARDNVILMDLRGFSRQHRGCTFELTHLIAHVPLERVVVVTDATTDWNVLREIVETAWQQQPLSGANRMLTRLTLKTVSIDPIQSLFRVLLTALSPRAGEAAS